MRDYLLEYTKHNYEIASKIIDLINKKTWFYAIVNIAFVAYLSVAIYKESSLGQVWYLLLITILLFDFIIIFKLMRHYNFLSLPNSERIISNSIGAEYSRDLITDNLIKVYRQGYKAYVRVIQEKSNYLSQIEFNLLSVFIIFILYNIYPVAIETLIKLLEWLSYYSSF